MFPNHAERESSQALIMDRHGVPQRRIESDYLEPTPSTRKKQEWNPPGGPPVQSPDSGVGLEGVQLGELSASWKQPSYRNPVSYDNKFRPESIAVEGHEYEQLPGARRQHTVYADIPEDPNIAFPPKLPTPPNSRTTSMTDVHSISRTEYKSQPSEQRRRENPLYDSMPEYKSMGSLMTEYPPSKSSRCVCVMSILAILLAIGALALGVVVIILLNNQSTTPAPSSGASTQGDQSTEKLQSRIVELEKKLSSLEKNMGGSSAINEKVDNNAVQINTMLQNITSQQTSIEKLLRSVDSTGLDVSQVNNSLQNLTLAVLKVVTTLGQVSVELSNKTADLDLTKNTVDQHTTQILNMSREQDNLVSGLANAVNKSNSFHAQVLSSNHLFSTQLASLNHNLSSQHSTVLSIQDSLPLIQQSLDQQLLKLNSSLFTELSVISKMEGPIGPQGVQGIQGPSGAGNLSGCRLKTVNIGSSLMDTSTTTTAWIPETSDWKILGVECMTTGGTSALVERGTENGLPKFRCKCQGRDPDHNSSKRCYTLVWGCPVIS